jgi:hypothetical protein
MSFTVSEATRPDPRRYFEHIGTECVAGIALQGRHR